MLIKFAGDRNWGWDFHKVTDKALVKKFCFGVKMQLLFLQMEGGGGGMNLRFPFSGRAFIEQETGRSC